MLMKWFSANPILGTAIVVGIVALIVYLIKRSQQSNANQRTVRLTNMPTHLTEDNTPVNSFGKAMNSTLNGGKIDLASVARGGEGAGSANAKISNHIKGGNA